MAPVYYNEINEYAADWLERLISAGALPDGDVDRRDIRDVLPSDVYGYTHCHFFAGIGGWAHALRLAGWPADRPVWTGSCPCQPFSAAGRRAGFADERHLWPAWFWLIQQCRPVVLFGEQVDAAVGHAWLDLVSSDLEGEDYAIGPVVLPAAGIGAPHGRHRLWFVADTDRERRDRLDSLLRPEEAGPHSARYLFEIAGSGEAGALAAANGGIACDRGLQRSGGYVQQQTDSVAAEWLEQSGRVGWKRREKAASGNDYEWSASIGSESEYGVSESVAHRLHECAADATDGFWRRADWVRCRDDKFRPVEPGTFPLAHGIPNRMGRLRAYGNAIVPQVAAEVIKAYLAVSG